MTDQPETGGLPDDPDERSSEGFVAWLDALADVRDEDELFKVLGEQRPPGSRLARQQIRGRLVKVLSEKLKELGSGVAAARTADAWLQEGGDDDDLLQGKEFVADEVEPWADAVSGAAVLDETRELFSRYVYTTRESLDVLALWAIYSHAFDCFGISPILDISSPTKRCGKSTAIVVLRRLCRKPLLSGNISASAVFRAVEAWKPTLLIDEADSFATMNDALRGIVNAGHTRDTAFVIRSEGDTNEPRVFSTWAPKVIAAIGRLPDTIEDRSIRIVLARKPTSITTRDAFDPETVKAACDPVRRRIARFVLDSITAISTAEIERPDGLHDRGWNNWRPLLTVAAAAGGDWPARARSAAQVLSGANADGDSEDVGTLALQHVWQVLEPAGRLATADILAHLVGKDEGPWAKWWESAFARGELKGPSARLAKLLKPFGVKPKQLWIDDANTRGYDADDWRTDTVSPYLEKDARDAKDARPRTAREASSSVPNVPNVFSGVPETPVSGDPGFPDWIDAKLQDGWITKAEWLERRKLHHAVVEAA